MWRCQMLTCRSGNWSEAFGSAKQCDALHHSQRSRWFGMEQPSRTLHGGDQLLPPNDMYVELGECSMSRCKHTLLVHRLQPIVCVAVVIIFVS